jgi:molecular chaperone GrpE
MSEKDNINEEELNEELELEQNEEVEDTVEDQTEATEDNATESLEAELTEQKDKYLRLYSEFENYRRRTAREKLEMIKTANEDLVKEMLSVLDDFDRADGAFEKNPGDVKALKEGLDLIAGKFRKVLEQKGVKEMNSKQGTTFDPEVHEAITQIPAPSKKLKGKIVDTVEKGYYLDEKVVRYAKVVIGG